MPRNEAQTRYELVDPALAERGWKRSDIRVEETARPIDIVHHQARRRPTGRTDYVLRQPLSPGSEPIPLAIIEAKHEGLPPEHGLQQGKGYRIGQLHHVPFIFSSNGHLFVEYDEETGVTSESFQFRSDYGKRYFFLHAKQTTGIATINRTVLSNFPLLVPLLDEQQRVANKIKAELHEAQKLREHLLEKLATLDKIPAALLREAFGGGPASNENGSTQPT